MLVVTLLCHSYSVPAIVAAIGLDERTVMAWLHRAGVHGARVHETLVATRQVDVGHMQADEIYVKVFKGHLWHAMALAVPTRLWLGGALSPTRDGALVAALLHIGMWLVGTAYNFCWPHDSLRLRAIGGRRRQRRTPAMVAGLSDHIWAMEELLRYRVLPAEAALPPWRSRPSNVISLARRRRAKSRAREAVA